MLILLNKYFNYLERKEMKIDITSKALDKLKNILEEKNSSALKVRIFLAGIG